MERVEVMELRSMLRGPIERARRSGIAATDVVRVVADAMLEADRSVSVAEPRVPISQEDLLAAAPLGPVDLLGEPRGSSFQTPAPDGVRAALERELAVRTLDELDDRVRRSGPGDAIPCTAEVLELDRARTAAAGWDGPAGLIQRVVDLERISGFIQDHQGWIVSVDERLGKLETAWGELFRKAGRLEQRVIEQEARISAQGETVTAVLTLSEKRGARVTRIEERLNGLEEDHERGES